MELMWAAKTVAGSTMIGVGPLCSGSDYILLYKLPGVQGDRGHREEDASWR